MPPVGFGTAAAAGEGENPAGAPLKKVGAPANPRNNPLEPAQQAAARGWGTGQNSGEGGGQSAVRVYVSSSWRWGAPWRRQGPPPSQQGGRGGGPGARVPAAGGAGALHTGSIESEKGTGPRGEWARGRERMNEKRGAMLGRERKEEQVHVLGGGLPRGGRDVPGVRALLSAHAHHGWASDRPGACRPPATPPPCSSL